MIKFEIIIVSDPDREKLVAEIWHGDDLIAEINQENYKLEIELYQKITLDYNDFLNTLEQAKNRLMGL